jgi:Protein of unknown function (DUF3040)
MDEDQVSQVIDDIERGLRREDPAFVQRLRRLQRRDDATVLSAFVLLAAGAVLLITGLATKSWPTAAAGVAALAACVLVDNQRPRILGRARRP